MSVCLQLKIYLQSAIYIQYQLLMQVPARKLTTDKILSTVLFRGAATREARSALRKDPVAMTIIVVTIK